MTHPKRRCRNCGRMIAIRQMSNHHWRGNRCKAQSHGTGRLVRVRWADFGRLYIELLNPGPLANAIITDIQDPGLS